MEMLYNGQNCYLNITNITGNFEERYSFEETKIGVWVDENGVEKPLYSRKVIVPNPGTINVLADIYTVPDGQLVVSFESYVYWHNSGSQYNLQPIPICSLTDSGEIVYFTIYNMKRPNVFKARTNNSGWISSSTSVLLILKYIKTTD